MTPRHRNAYGQLGLEDTENRGDDTNEIESVLLNNAFKPSKVVAGWFFNCALSDQQAVRCWGNNWFYQIGDGTSYHRGYDSGEMGAFMPTGDLGNDFVTIDIEAGGLHVCAMSEYKEIKCWGMWLDFVSPNISVLFGNTM